MRLLLIALLLCSTAAVARDPGGKYAQQDPERHEFFDSLKNKNNGSCCSDADGVTIKDVDWDTKDGHYRVFLEGSWIDVPDWAVVETPNKYGPAVVWPLPYKDSDGKIQIRCFMPGAGA